MRPSQRACRMMSVLSPRITARSLLCPSNCRVKLRVASQPLSAGHSAGSPGFNLRAGSSSSHSHPIPDALERDRAWPARGSSAWSVCVCVRNCVCVREMCISWMKAAQTNRRRGPAFVALRGRPPNPQRVCIERWGDALSRMSLTVCDSLKLRVSRCLLHPSFQPSIPLIGR